MPLIIIIKKAGAIYHPVGDGAYSLSGIIELPIKGGASPTTHSISSEERMS